MKNKCVLPFIGHDYSNDSPCCLLLNKDGTSWDNNKSDVQDLIQEHRAGVKTTFCKQCWNTEETGVISKRQQYNQYYKKYFHLTKRNVKKLTIPVGNVCNLYCVICNPGSSTSWIKKQMSFRQQNITSNYEITTQVNPRDIQNIKEAEHVEFIGGETLKSFSLWGHLSNMDKSTSFSLQTNGTVELNKEQIDLLRSFENFNICFSIDGYGKIFEYIRQPAKWTEICSNIDRYKNYFGKDKLSIYLTLCNLNILYIDKIMIELFKLLPTKIEINLVSYPYELSYKNLPKHVGKIVEEKNPGFFKDKKIEWAGTDMSISKMKQNLNAQDKFSGLKKENFLPELFDLI
jgi:hypothetical protein